VRIANSATSTAPWITNGNLLPASPSKIGVPRVRAPTVEPIVAVPIAIVTDTLTPARITGAASGRSTSRNICHADKPIPRAASRVAAGTPSRPAIAFSIIGKSP